MFPFFPFTVFLYCLNWSLLLIVQKKKNLKYLRTSSFPKYRSSCAASAHSNQLASLSSPAAFLFGGLLKGEGKDSSSTAKSTAFWKDFCLSFSPDLDLQVQIHWSVYKLVHCLFILEDLTYIWICQKYKFPQVLCQFKWGLFLPSWVLPLSCAVASYALCVDSSKHIEGCSWIRMI